MPRILVILRPKFSAVGESNWHHSMENMATTCFGYPTPHNRTQPTFPSTSWGDLATFFLEMQSALSHFLVISQLPGTVLKTVFRTPPLPSEYTGTRPFPTFPRGAETWFCQGRTQA